MKNLSNLAQNIQPSATVAITSKAKTLKENGKDIIIMSVGEPDFDTPEAIKQNGIKAIKNGFVKYTQASGINEIKQKIANRYNKKYNLNYTKENIVVSNGGKHALFNALASILNNEDEAIIPPIHWVSYIDLVKFFNAIPIVPKGDSAIFDFENLESYITPKTKAIIINSPSNPTGEIFSSKQLKKLANIAEKYDLFIISDEIYDELIYDNNEINSIATISKKIEENTIIINGFSKSHSMTGWRLGYSIANKKITDSITKIQGQTTNHPSSISQYAALKFDECQKEINKMIQTYSERRDIVNEILKDIPQISYKTPKGAFYYFINVSKCFNNKIKNSIDFSKFLLDQYLVATVPGVAFGNDDYIRISFAMDNDTLKQGLNRIKKAINSLK